MKLNDQATFWLDSWVNPKTNTNETARENAKAIALHIASLQAALQEAYKISHYGRGSMQDIDDVLERAIRASQSAKSEKP